MIKPASLERLRDISKQRSIRRPLLVPVSTDHSGNAPDHKATKIEWPISG